MSDYAALGIFLVLTLIFPVAAMLAARLFRPRSDTGAEKLMPYECGVDPKGSAWVRVKINYFLYALVFLAFDVETIFLFPWAVHFKHLGWFAFVEMVIFLIILVTGLWYAWKERALEWY